MSIEIGNVVLDNYKLIYELGHGRSGVVFLAMNQASRELRAIKIIEIHNQNSAFEISKSLQKTVQTFDNIRHPQIVHIEHFGFDEKRKLLCIVMPYISGRNLADYIGKTGLLDIKTALSIVQQIAKIVDIVHKKGLIHGALKPQNIILLSDNKVILTDVGLYPVFNKLVIDETAPLNDIQYYTAPEYFDGVKSNNDTTVDIYALGIIMFELLTGRYPLGADTAEELTNKYQNNIAMPALSLYTPNVPARLDALVEKSLQYEPSLRYSRGMEVAREIDFILRQEDIAGSDLSPVASGTVSYKNKTPLEIFGEAPALFVDLAREDVIYPLYPPKELYIVGRRTDKNKDVDINLFEDKTVSRLHAHIYHKNNSWLIRDTSGKTPPRTQINNQAVSSSRGIVLKDGDICQFGRRTQLVFRVKKDVA